MFARNVASELILRPCPDRRAVGRLEHREPIMVGNHPAIARDISARGLAVVMREPVAVGELVRVSLTVHAGSPVVTSAKARVARVHPQIDQFVVGLEFVA